MQEHPNGRQHLKSQKSFTNTLYERNPVITLYRKLAQEVMALDVPILSFDPMSNAVTASVLDISIDTDENVPAATTALASVSALALAAAQSSPSATASSVSALASVPPSAAAFLGSA